MNETVAEKFWRESHEEREWREATEGLHGVERVDAILKHVWTSLPLRKSLVFDWKPRDLDEWLSEDGWIREVGEALGFQS